MITKERVAIFGIIFFFMLAFLNCAPGNERWDEVVNPGNRANFWAGIWHGLIIIVTFIISLFTSDVGLYEANNVGWAYNLGFVLGLFLLFGPILKAGGGHKKKLSKHDCDKLGDKIEEKVRSGIRSWLDETDKEKQKEKEWDEIASRIEEKVRKALKEWLDKD